jgi:integrase
VPRHRREYRLPNGRQRWATIGRHGSPWTVETARKEALRLLGQIAEGEDPVEVKTTQRADLTVSLSTLEADGKNSTAIAAIRLLLFTGCRRGEIIGLRWQWVDFERRCIRFSDSKTGAKTVPLGDPAIDLLRGVPAVEGSEFVFPASRRSGHIVGLRSVWAKVTQTADLRGLRVHDLLHSFASVAVSEGESLYIVGKILGHRQARTTEVYAHLASDPVQAAADRAARKIAEALQTRA